MFKDIPMKKFLKTTYNDIVVYWRPELSGGGLSYGQQFIPVTKKLFGKVKRIHEFCAGPGFIGFSLLANGLCDTLCLSDINPEAIKAMKLTVKKNRLEDKVDIYLSNGLKNIPEYEKWDLVVSNPPHFSYDVGRGIIATDPKWNLHKNFYQFFSYSKPSQVIDLKSS